MSMVKCNKVCTNIIQDFSTNEKKQARVNIGHFTYVTTLVNYRWDVEFYDCPIGYTQTVISYPTVYLGVDKFWFKPDHAYHFTIWSDAIEMNDPSDETFRAQVYTGTPMYDDSPIILTPEHAYKDGSSLCMRIDWAARTLPESPGTNYENYGLYIHFNHPLKVGSTVHVMLNGTESYQNKVIETL